MRVSLSAPMMPDKLLLVTAEESSASSAKVDADGGQEQQALGRSQGGFSTKIHLRAEGGGKPITLRLTAGERHEQSAFEPLMEQGAVKRAGRGRPRLRPERVIGDKG